MIFDKMPFPHCFSRNFSDWNGKSTRFPGLFRSSGLFGLIFLAGVNCAGAQNAAFSGESARDDLLAQNYGYPPGDISDGGDRAYGRAPGQDVAGLLVRIDKLENQVRQLTGQLEQMQFSTHRLEDQLKKFQSDVDFRLQENAGRGNGAPVAPALKGGQKRGEGPESPASPMNQTAAGDEDVTPVTNSGRSSRRRGDAFDPDADPDAPGTPRPLGTTPPSKRASETVNAPLDLAGGRLRSDNTVSPTAPRNAGPDPVVSAGGTVIASASANPTKEDYDLALGYLRQKEYEAAEKSFTAFLAKNSKSRLTPDAIYYLGETYYQRGRQREAAEQYLKISTHYANSNRAPEAMLRLGQSLNALGAKEQACATFGEIDRKYPNASPQVKASAEREARRLQC
ncbi:tol-pal system protein YbgF [Beijerinckia indica]|uniref:Cell division coordinator CpoB n=1 Tax=Beijerinckia indica subsp. indica (strain ATCC 9039 / DSM 1715 / NCIMB 8712) TaxID=395963 RepID=B2IGB4_BEII9|nr:tol-pal system protein YbgF [Beijerinckia indica]ACB97188.1 tol-pal system protein YbgF [Beijerinckia indica subsp. indica ATCC 9039]